MDSAYTTHCGECNHGALFALITARDETVPMGARDEKRQFLKEFGLRLKRAREDRKLTQAGLATAVGWESAQTRISNYEKGVREPQLFEVQQLASALGMRAASLAFGDLTTDAPPETIKYSAASPGWVGTKTAAQLNLEFAAYRMSGGVPDKQAVAIAGLIYASAAADFQEPEESDAVPPSGPPMPKKGAPKRGKKRG